LFAEALKPVLAQGDGKDLEVGPVQRVYLAATAIDHYRFRVQIPAAPPQSPQAGAQHHEGGAISRSSAFLIDAGKYPGVHDLEGAQVLLADAADLASVPVAGGSQRLEAQVPGTHRLARLLYRGELGPQELHGILTDQVGHLRILAVFG
jgi:hypothetical protein